MRGMIWWLLVLLLAVTIFALSNTAQVTVMFWQWPIYTGSLALAVVGAGLIGALATLLPALLRQSHLGGRIRELERARRGQEETASSPAASGPGTGYPPSSSSTGTTEPTGRIDDTRRFP